MECKPFAVLDDFVNVAEEVTLIELVLVHLEVLDIFDDGVVNIGGAVKLSVDRFPASRPTFLFVIYTVLLAELVPTFGVIYEVLWVKCVVALGFIDIFGDDIGVAGRFGELAVRSLVDVDGGSMVIIVDITFAAVVDASRLGALAVRSLVEVEGVFMVIVVDLTFVRVGDIFGDDFVLASRLGILAV